jgi:predicted glycogen debranching enzyme
MTTPLPIVFGPQVCGSLPEGGDREWLVPDGLGGYAMGTVCGLRTRRYHGLLVVADGTGGGRRLGLAALDPVLVLDSGQRVPLGVQEWRSGTVDPAGHTYLERFDLTDGLPRWRWRVGHTVLERELAAEHGLPATAVVFRLLAGGPVRLEVEALCTWRDSHAQRFGGDPLRADHDSDGVVIEDAYRLRGPGWEPGGNWYLGVHAREEAERGLGADEDLWYAGRFAATLRTGETLLVSAGAGDLGRRPPPATAVIAAARRRAGEIVNRADPADEVDAALALAADAFVITRSPAGTPSGPDVVAGYPWFGTWSRDTMVSFEGLFLATGRADEGGRLLRSYAATLSEGMLANTADTGSTEYNTADATLWFLHAVGRYVATTGDTGLAADLLPALDRIVAAHVAGTRYGIRVDPADGLLAQGQPGYALTWMDARVGGVGVTPRIGKAVELNALWLHGLAQLSALTRLAGRDPAGLTALLDQGRASFAARFPAPQGWLYDVVDGPTGDDAKLRPNQLIALALADGVTVDPAGPIRAATEALLTPLGLRTLAPGSPSYRGLHRGEPMERDAAYHQGTVWPWLTGPLAEACVRAGLPTAGLLTGLEAHLREWGLGSVSETADGDPPHRASGCPFQAWSVAELVRARRLLHATGPGRSLPGTASRGDQPHGAQPTGVQHGPVRDPVRDPGAAATAAPADPLSVPASGSAVRTGQ